MADVRSGACAAHARVARDRIAPAVAPQERAFGIVKVGVDGALLRHEPLAGQPAGRRALTLVYPVHTGSWLGMPGRMAMMLGAVSLPLLFAVGVYLTLGRNGQRRR